MSKILTKTASILAFVIGAMAIFSGGRVILGHIPDYYVIDWVPIYNFSIGVISAAVTAILIWKNHKHALAATIATLLSHSTVMVILQTAYLEVVAPDSIRAMTIRISVWSVILFLLLVQAWKTKTSRERKVTFQGDIRTTGS